MFSGGDAGTADGQHNEGFLGKRRAFSVPTEHSECLSALLPPSTFIHRENLHLHMCSHTEMCVKCTHISIFACLSLSHCQPH